MRRRRTPFSSISAEIALILTVWGTSTEVGPLLFLGEYRLALNNVLTSVDFPSPLSPASVSPSKPPRTSQKTHNNKEQQGGNGTNDHDVEIEALADRLAMPLIRQIRKANIPSQLPPDNIRQLCILLLRHKRRRGTRAIGITPVHIGRGGRCSGRWRRRRTCKKEQSASSGLEGLDCTTGPGETRITP